MLNVTPPVSLVTGSFVPQATEEGDFRKRAQHLEDPRDLGVIFPVAAPRDCTGRHNVEQTVLSRRSYQPALIIYSTLQPSHARNPRTAWGHGPSQHGFELDIILEEISGPQDSEWGIERLNRCLHSILANKMRNVREPLRW